MPENKLSKRNLNALASLWRCFEAGFDLKVGDDNRVVRRLFSGRYRPEHWGRPFTRRESVVFDLSFLRDRGIIS